jgi:hypothetical protein
MGIYGSILPGIPVIYPHRGEKANQAGVPPRSGIGAGAGGEGRVRLPLWEKKTKR